MLSLSEKKQLTIKQVIHNLKKLNKRLLFIEGNIGAGKTHFINNDLSNHEIFSVDFKQYKVKDKYHIYYEGINERHLVNLSKIIDKTRSEKAAPYILRFQNSIQRKSIYYVNFAIKKNLDAIFDRSFIGHYVFALAYYFTGYINKQQLLDYEKFNGFDWKKKKLPIDKSKFIILHIFKTVRKCSENIEKRNNESDKFITREYLYIIQWCYYCFYRHFGLLNSKEKFSYCESERFKYINFNTFDVIRPILKINRIKERMELYAFQENYIDIEYEKSFHLTVIKPT